MQPTKSTISKAAKLAELIADQPVWYDFCENHENELDSLCGKIVEADEGGTGEASKYWIHGERVRPVR